MLGYRFQQFTPLQDGSMSSFDKLWDIFKQLLLITSGDVNEALSWLNNLDLQHQITDENYGIGDFIEDLKKKGYIDKDPVTGKIVMTGKSEQDIRRSALEEIFGNLKKSQKGGHRTPYIGKGDEITTDRREYRFGDAIDQVSMTDSIRNAQIHHGISDFTLQEGDLEIFESEHKTTTSTVLMIDISHSMILYGEDRITPAKKVAMALAELITRRYPEDSLDIIVFGNDAWRVAIKDLPYLQVGPYHTNTVAGLELAMDILRRKRHGNKQIFMITDGKPTCLKEGIRYYKNSYGLDRKILTKTLGLATRCRKLKIPITTYMIASDPYLREFVREFTNANNGTAYYSNLHGLGDLVFEDYKRNRRKTY